MGRFTVHFMSFTYNFTQVKVKKVGRPRRVTLHVEKIILTQKRYCEVSIIIAVN